MPHLLNMTDGTTTLPLSTTSAMLEYFVPQTPTRGDGGKYEPVGETVELMLYGASTTAVQTAYNNLQRMVLAAERRQKVGAGPRLFLQYQPIGDPTLWRSEILAGDVRLGKMAMTAFGQAKLPVQLIVERAHYWEGGLTAIPASNGNGSNNTTGLRVYGHDDSTAGHDNWMDIAAGVIGGVLPAPLEIQMQNATGASQGYGNFYIANNTFAPSLTHIIEAETRKSGYSGSAQADSNSSGGSRLVMTGTTNTVAWDLPASLLQATAGRHMRLLARIPFYAASPRVYVRAAVRDYYGITTLAEQATETLLNVNDDYIADLGLLPLPPGGYSTNWSQHVLYITFRAASSASIALDFIQLTPAEEYCYRHVEQRGGSVNANDWIVDDGIEGLQYLIEGGVNHSIYTAHTPPLHVFPNMAQRLYFLHDGIGAVVDWSLNAKLRYRPRRLTI